MVQSLTGIACCLLFAHLRSSNPLMQSTLATAVEQSSTVRELVEVIDASDVVAYIDFVPLRDPSVGARVSFISAAGGRRYVHVGVDPRSYGSSTVMALIGHELQHVAEIAADPSIVDEKTLTRCYRTLGFSTPTSDGVRFETGAAIAAGHRVLEEVRAFRSHASTERTGRQR